MNESKHYHFINSKIRQKEFDTNKEFMKPKLQEYNEKMVNFFL